MSKTKIFGLPQLADDLKAPLAEMGNFKLTVLVDDGEISIELTNGKGNGRAIATNLGVRNSRLNLEIFSLESAMSRLRILYEKVE